MDGGLSMSKPSKVKPVTTILLMYAFIYVTAHPEYVIAFSFGVGRSSNLGCCDQDIQFRLKNERNPGISFVNVDQDLCLVYIQGPLAPSYTIKEQKLSK